MGHREPGRSVVIRAEQIAGRLGLHATGRDWRGSCPICGYGADAFVLSEKDGRVLGWCANCRDSGRIGAILRRGDRLSEQPALKPKPASSGASATPKRARALGLWGESQPIDGTPAEAYLAGRGVWGWSQIGSAAALRFHPRCPHPSGARQAAMIAPVRHAVTGEPQAIHRTFIRPNGAGKADIVPSKASLGPVAGGVIMLQTANTGEAIIIAEGIETALSAGLLMLLPVWAAVSCGNLEHLTLPTELCRRIIIATDTDQPGQRAARAAARKWQREGRQVQIALPTTDCNDFNDILIFRNKRHG